MTYACMILTIRSGTGLPGFPMVCGASAAYRAAMLAAGRSVDRRRLRPVGSSCRDS